MNTLTTPQLFESLAPYLPYELEMKIPDNYQFSGYRTSAKSLPLTGIQGGYIKLSDISGFYPIKDFKPLLIPLSALTDELAEWLAREHSFTPKNAKMQIDKVLNYPDEYPFYLVQQIFKLHGDLFSLIETGYGVNKLEVK